MTNLDSILKSIDITLPTKVCLVKAMVFPVIMYGCLRLRLGSKIQTLGDGKATRSKVLEEIPPKDQGI